MKKSTAKQQAQNIAKNHAQPKKAECTEKTPNSKALLGHKVILKKNEGMWSDDVTCPKNSGHKEFASEGHIMPKCIYCGRVSLKASRNGLEKTVWTTSE